MLTVGGLFSGIGGFELGLVRAGFEITWMCEIDEFCKKVLRKHAPAYWPDAEILGDIKDAGKHNLKPVDLICGGFPCQPFSDAGNKRGKADDRYLWPEMLRVIRELSPRWIIGENVAGFINMELESAFTDLEAEGYQVEAFVLPANAIDAPHQRNRIYIVAYPASQNGRCIQRVDTSSESLYPPQREEGPPEINGSGKAMAHANGQRLALRQGQQGNPQQKQPPVIGSCGKTGRGWLPEPSICRVADGIPHRMDRLRTLGNAVVPQIVEVLGRMILQVEAAQPDHLPLWAGG